EQQHKQRKMSKLANFPCEILANIAKNLEDKDLVSFSLTCKKFNYVANDKYTKILRYEKLNEVVKKLYSICLKNLNKSSLFRKFIKNLEKLINISDEVKIKPTWLSDEVKEYDKNYLCLLNIPYYIMESNDDLFCKKQNFNKFKSEIRAKIKFYKKISDLYPGIYIKLLS
ncbi:MAG: F-box protein, partial [Candidatus Dojkabacteria bacterium]|nr:F-box protein [Candidatus Dojkabacteria bacterium]